MALAQTNTTHGFGLTRALAAFGRGFIAFMDNWSQASSRMEKVKALQALSDEQLAERGLKRDDIVRYVFADRYWV
ncbi:DUF1127 domain-containing protein [Actibacterium pelagium]|uniref:DUF1127 domain-containing protein n=1 Tax=Actibacterium pelagium TaxID=2029103 RepID=A0A917ABN8_9RHOB|nr:DUF1127 domain-containing protein [Actibacterium pelagium]GGE37191.1 hypothetical protein GCM10011517_01150 [Actibacterium pelagium]